MRFDAAARARLSRAAARSEHRRIERTPKLDDAVANRDLHDIAVLDRTPNSLP